MGLRYVVSLVSPAQAGDDDLSLESEGVRVLVDPAAQTHLRGVTIDFTDEGFSVRNPHARGACACGASFADDLPAARG
jgi:iron-sulfur cluster assembly accessory protein